MPYMTKNMIQAGGVPSTKNFLSPKPQTKLNFFFTSDLHLPANFPARGGVPQDQKFSKCETRGVPQDQKFSKSKTGGVPQDIKISNAGGGGVGGPTTL